LLYTYLTIELYTHNMSDENIENIISVSDIKKYGMMARNTQANIQGNCGKIADEFEGYLIDYCGLPYTGEIVNNYGVMHIRVGPNGEEKHFVFYIDGKYVEGYFEGEEIFVDLSFDQFNNKNKKLNLVSVSYGKKEDIDKIRIMKPDDDRLSAYSFVGEKLFKTI